jgi:predicted RNA binding protein YcfA (HicA-like mRNA interferase family)
MAQKLPLISGKDAVKAFARTGWHLDRISGSHAILRKEGSAVTLFGSATSGIEKGSATLFNKGCSY